MNKFAKAIIHIPCAWTKILINKIRHPKSFFASYKSAISPFTEISLNSGGYLKIGSGFKMRDGAKLRVRKNAICTIGKNVLINSNNIIACRQSISIGNNVQLSPGVLIYDHDHDYQCLEGLSALKYKCSSVDIGDNVWIGANCVILRGTQIGDNSVVAAGSVIKGVYPANSMIYQKKETQIKTINRSK